VRHLGEALSILFVNETITEHSVSLANEEGHKVVLVRDVFILAHKHTLDNLWQITQVESVMALSRRGQEFVNSLLVDVYSWLHDVFSEDWETTTLLELQVTTKNGSENSLHGGLWKVGYPNHVEVTEEAGGYSVSATTGGSATSNELGVLDKLEEQLLNVPETTLINDLSEELTRRLGTVGLKLRHVNIIDEEDFAGSENLRREQVLTLLVQITFECILQVSTGSLTREVHKGGVNALIWGHKVILGNDGLTDTSFTWQKYVVTGCDEDSEKVLVLDCVVGGNEDIEEVEFRVVLEGWNLFLPGLETMISLFETVLVNVTLGEFGEMLSHLATEEFSEHGAGGIVQVGTDGPHETERQVSENSLVWVRDFIFVFKWNSVLVQENVDHLQAGAD
jgi:hypothetical protein